MPRVVLTVEDTPQGVLLDVKSDPPFPEDPDAEFSDAQHLASHLTAFFRGYLVPQYGGVDIATTVERTEYESPREAVDRFVRSEATGDLTAFPDLIPEHMRRDPAKLSTGDHPSPGVLPREVCPENPVHG